MANGAVVAHLKGKIAQRKAVMTAIFRESSQRTIEIMQTPMSQGGRMRVDTGFLRASLVATLGQANYSVRTKPAGDAKFSYDAGRVSLVIASAEVTDKITAVYTANYARPREYKGDRFVAMAAQQWPRVVSEVSREAQGRAAR